MATSAISPKSARITEADRCLARSMVETLATEPALEAVTIDRAQQKISVATLGRSQSGANEELTSRVTREMKTAQAVSAGHECSLLLGHGDCGTCDIPLPEDDRKKITTEITDQAATIARVTCPTAPKFWRWRELPFPHIEPRVIEIEKEDEEHANEWKWQLAAAIVCGVFGLAGYFLHRAGLQTYSVIGFVVAYFAGGFFPAEEVWERLQKRILDVHFLMLAVAVGAAFINAWAEGATLLFLFSFSGALEHYAMGRTQKEIRSLFRDAPKTATAG